MSRFDNLAEWLNWLEISHPKTIDLGLERVFNVASKLNLLLPATEISHSFSGPFNFLGLSPTKVVTIAGTNGKGSCVASLESGILFHNKAENSLSAPIVGSYTSPHFDHYCERIKIDGAPVSEDMVCEAFAAIDAARGSVSLTYFEFGTLAALWIFQVKKVPTILLEVGLGGRLDAVNIIDADIAIITSIDLDHQDWLGDSREAISREKLGIARDSRPLIIGETTLTPSLLAASNRAEAITVNKDFYFNVIDDKHWQINLSSLECTLPLTNMPLASVVAAIVTLDQLGMLPSNVNDMATIISGLKLRGRFEKITINDVEVIFDVAHNPAATKSLAMRLSGLSTNASRSLPVFAIMQDKDHKNVIEPLLAEFDSWYLGELIQNNRALKAEELSEIIKTLANNVNRLEPTILMLPRIEDAFDLALSKAKQNDRVIVFGSFFTVAAIQKHVNKMLEE